MKNVETANDLNTGAVTMPAKIIRVLALATAVLWPVNQMLLRVPTSAKPDVMLIEKMD